MIRRLIASHGANALVLTGVALLTWLGLKWFALPPIYRLAYTKSPLAPYYGHTLMILAIALAWFHQWAAHFLRWLGGTLHRLLSSLLVIGALGLDATMHLFSIPHLEGWWLPLLSGSAIAGIGTWLHRHISKRRTR